MKSSRLALLALGLSLTPLNGCATGASDRICLPLRAYPLEMQQKAADELERLGVDSVTGQFIADYGMLRDQVRAMCGAEI